MYSFLQKNAKEAPVMTVKELALELFSAGFKDLSRAGILMGSILALNQGYAVTKNGQDFFTIEIKFKRFHEDLNHLINNLKRALEYCNTAYVLGLDLRAHNDDNTIYVNLKKAASLIVSRSDTYLKMPSRSLSVYEIESNSELDKKIAELQPVCTRINYEDLKIVDHVTFDVLMPTLRTSIIERELLACTTAPYRRYSYVLTRKTSELMNLSIYRQRL